VLDSVLVAGRSHARRAASVIPRLAGLSSITPPASVMATLASPRRWSIARWCTRTPLSIHIDVTPLALCVSVSTTVPGVGSVASRVVARGTSGSFSGLTSTAVRPSASSSGSVGTPSPEGSSTSVSDRLGSKFAAKASETSRVVIPGSSRFSIARLWAADIDGVPRVTSSLSSRISSRAGRVDSRRTPSSASAISVVRAS
jgi:hypothetical protein